MIMLKAIGIFVIVLASVIILGCVESQSNAPTSIESPKSTVVPIATPKSTSDDRQIVITVNTTKTNSIKWYTGTRDNYPSQGYTFLIVTMIIENNGYETFDLWSPGFRLVFDGIAYHPVDSGRFLLKNQLPTNVDILNTGTISGSIVFEVPSNLNEYNLQYEQQGYYNIKNIVFKYS